MFSDGHCVSSDEKRLGGNEWSLTVQLGVCFRKRWQLGFGGVSKELRGTGRLGRGLGMELTGPGTGWVWNWGASDIVSDTRGCLYLHPPSWLPPNLPWGTGPGSSVSGQLPESLSQANPIHGNKVKEKPFSSRKINETHKPEEKKILSLPPLLSTHLSQQKSARGISQ